jgi:hypothetical protein
VQIVRSSGFGTAVCQECRFLGVLVVGSADYNRTTGGRKVNKRGVEVLVVVDTPRQGDFGCIAFLQGHKRR